MQDIHLVEGGGSGERRLRPHHHHPSSNQSLKCPRCDSSNTKFCYYNNYNLSQPRHFCKGCRRYWTKGGVLRNVPVGGGCRKTKRSSRPKSSDSLPVVHPKSSSNSSSESSSLTATTTTAVATEAVSASSSRSPPTGFLNIQEFMNPSQGFDHEILEESTNCGFFSGIGNFTSLINSSNDDQLSFRFDNLLDPQNQWPQSAEVAGSGAAVVELKAQQPAAAEEAPTFLDEDDVKVKFSPAPETQPSCTSIFGPSDWQPSSDQGLFDLPNAVDHGYNWSQPNPWTDGDHPSYIP